MRDGNKRLATTAAAPFLEENGLPLRADQDELVDFTLAVVQGTRSVRPIATWLRRRAAKA